MSLVEIHPVETNASPDFPGRDGTDGVWAFVFKDDLGDAQREAVKSSLDAFLPTWTCHGAKVDARAMIWKSRAVILTGRSEESLGGCSIDSAFRIFKSFRDKGMDSLDRSLVHYLDASGAVKSVPRHVFAGLVKDGTVTGDTPVVDVSAATLADLRSRGLVRPFRESWHAKAFPASP